LNIIIIIAVILAYIAKGMAGFANTLIFSTILSFKANNINISPIETLLGFPPNAFLAWKERKWISAKDCILLSFLVIIGNIPGVILLKNGNVTVIKFLFGFVVIIVGVEMLIRMYKSTHKKSSPIVLIIIGIISGVMCGMFGIGAFLVAYVSRTTTNNSQFRGNLCMVFLVENTFRIILYIATGIINFEIFKNVLTLVPFMIIGLFIGIILSNKVSENVTKKIIVFLLILSGISLIINNIILLI